MDHSQHSNSKHANNHGENTNHDHTSMMNHPDAAANFLKRFYIVTILLVPLALFSEPAVKFLGAPDFVGRTIFEFIIASVIFYFGLIFFQHAQHEIKMRQLGMMTLVSVGVGSGYIFSAFSTFFPALETEFYLEISTLIWILLFGHFLEAKSSSAAGDALNEVAKLLPKKAHLKTKNEVKDVDLSTLKENDVVIIKPGEKVPADGIIIDGSSSFNESHITGESKPVEKKLNENVVAGAIAVDGSVEVKLEKVGESSTIGQIQKLISQAQQTKPSAQRLADKAASYLTISALFVALLTLIVWSVVFSQPLVFSATLAITVLVIACPHALGLAIPTVSTIATKLAIKNGIFLKNMQKIETIKKANYVVFDKTGTLTEGNFGVTYVQALNSNKKKLLEITAGIEQQSSHVIGTAIVKYTQDQNISFSKATKMKNLAGKGLTATYGKNEYFIGNQRLMKERDLWTSEVNEIMMQLSKEGKTPVFVASQEEIIGIIGLSDKIKQEAKQAIKELHSLGVKVAMLTGDTQAAADSVAQQIGIDTVFAEVLPEDKYKHIKQLQDNGETVIMAGDGVNDAPALTQADAGIAIGAGTDVAVEAGDIVLTKSNPQHIVRLLILSRKVYSKMIQNLWYALGYNIIAIPAAAGIFIPFGFKLSPSVGAVLMSLSSVVVVINAISLRKTKLEV